jgi:hypothetical protein
MANYTKTTNFLAKDSLVSGDTNKRIRGSEIDTELTNIQTAVNSKLDSSGFTASNIASGTLAIAYGGTGTSSTAYCNLASNVTGVLPVANGGTGLASIGGANTLLYTTIANSFASLPTTNTGVLVTSATGTLSYASGTTANRLLKTNGTTVSFTQADLTTDITGVLPIANGGTGANNIVDARTNLDVPQNNGTGASGTWNINISGNAATASNADTYSGTINIGVQATGVLPIANGGTGQSVASSAANALGVPGAGQSWASFSASRSINTDYQNTTGRPISVSVTLSTVTAGANNPRFWVSTTTPATGGVTVAYFSNGTTGNIDACVGPIIIPNNAYYRVQAAVGTSIVFWAELR